MNFLKNLFGGGGRPASSGDQNAIYLYVRPKMCQEVVKVRVNLHNDLSATEDEGGYFARKMVSATRCPFQAEVELRFDSRRTLISSDVQNGELVSAGDYQAWMESKTTQG